MKRVIKSGSTAKKAIYSRTCRCGCEFEYEMEDVEKTYWYPLDGVMLWYVSCPECGDKTGFEEGDPARVEVARWSP